MMRKACRRGSHAMGIDVPVGGGLVRRVCKYCKEVEIDLRNAADVIDEPPRGALFQDDERVSIFSIESALSYIPSGSETNWSVDELS